MINRPMNNLIPRIDRLPRDARGFPIPKFVHINEDGSPQFQLANAGHLVKCVKQNLCWICGDRMGRHKAFPIGPMCCVNRVTSEPPSHRECAIFAATNCPFLTSPDAKRNNRDLPDEKFVAGMMIERNPGVTAIWMTQRYRVVRVDNGVLFEIGDPDSVEFYARGRMATRDEVDHSVNTGLPILKAKAEEDGGDALKELAWMHRRFEKLIDEVLPS